jgi:hypothetical protein
LSIAKNCFRQDLRVKLGKGRWDFLLLVLLAHVYDVGQGPDGTETSELKSKRRKTAGCVK